MIRIAKKEETGLYKAIGIRILSIVAAIVLSGVFIALMGFHPVDTFRAMIKGSLGTASALRGTINLAIPLLVTALGISIAFRMKFWNIGAEGQIVMGAVFASFIVRVLSEDTNSFLMIPLMFVAAITGGALWALIPALFKAYSKTNETLFTLMLNYVAINITVYLRSVAWRDPESMGFPRMARIPEAARLPKVFDIHIGWIIALILALLVFIFIKYTKKGYEIQVVGESEKTGHYAGINVKKVLITGVLLSGAIAGITGMLKLSGSSYLLSETIGGGDGFTAIIIAWLSGLSAPVMVFVSVFFGAMRQGAMAIEVSMRIPSSIAGAIQGMILFCALASEFFIRYRIVIERKPKEDNKIKEDGRIVPNKEEQT